MFRNGTTKLGLEQYTLPERVFHENNYFWCSHARERTNNKTGRWELPGRAAGVRPHGLDRHGAQASPQEAAAGAAEAHPAVSRRAVDGEQRQKRGVSHVDTGRDSRYRHRLFSGIVWYEKLEWE